MYGEKLNTHGEILDFKLGKIEESMVFKLAREITIFEILSPTEYNYIKVLSLYLLMCVQI